MRYLRFSLTILLLLTAARDTYAQGCMMCLASAAAQGSQAMEAMNLGILILMLPSVLIITGVLLFTFVRRFN